MERTGSRYLNNNFYPTEEYLLGPGAEPVSVLDGGGNWLRTNLYATGKLLATYDSLGAHYALTDWLGTKRMQVSASGTVEERCGATLTSRRKKEIGAWSEPRGDGWPIGSLLPMAQHSEDTSIT